MSLESLLRRKFLGITCVLPILALLPACGGSGSSGDASGPPGPPTNYVYSRPADIGDGWTTSSATDLGVNVLLHDVLTMRMGLAWNEWDPPYTSPDNQMLRIYVSEIDYSKSLLDLPMANEPGAAFSYSTPLAPKVIR